MKKIIKASRSAYSVDDMYSMLIEYGIATEDEVNLVTDIAGYSEEIMEDILYVREGTRDFNDLRGEY